MDLIYISQGINKMHIMKQIKLGAGFIIFLLFFGVALLEAINTRNWMMVIFWAAIGLLFFVLDNQRSSRES
jgi:cell division protein FtsW (lipid II flippase)